MIHLFNFRRSIICVFLTFFMVTITSLSYAQTSVTVKGTVTDSSGEPIVGASVMVVGATTGVATDFDGKYTISVPSDAELRFSFIGLKSETIPVNNRALINVMLVDDKTFLESVVVVGYGTQKRGSVIGAVSGINSDDIIKTKSENTQNMLTGRIPGLRVWQRSAEPGSYQARLDIRGMGQILVVIDGIPRSTADFQRLNPADIDNVSVLKDASAAVYGVRGGNGVLLVTTKKGSAGKSKITYNGSFTFQTPSKMPKLATALEAMEIENEKGLNRADGNGSPVFTDETIQEFITGKRKAEDWNNLMIAKLAPQTQHDLSLSGGNEKFQYYVSMGYIYQEGFFKSRDLNYSKYNLRSTVSAEVFRGLHMDLNVAGLFDQQNNPYHSAEDIINNYWTQGVLYPAYADPEQTKLNYEGLDEMRNAVAMMRSDVSGHRINNERTFQSNVSLTYDFGTISDALAGLALKGTFSYDFTYDSHEKYRKEYYLYKKNDDGTYEERPYNNSFPSKLTRSAYNHQQVLGQLMLSYDRTFDEKHELSVILGSEIQRRTGDNFRSSGELVYPKPHFSALGTNNQSAGTDLGAYYDLRYAALLGRLNYSYDNRYLLEAQFRYDGSSKFAPGYNWGFFPSLSVGWRISEESFIKDNPNLNFINQLKLRASYGSMGDDNGVDYEWMTGYTYEGGDFNEYGYYDCYAPGYIFDGEFRYSVTPQPLPNKVISWFTSNTFDFGLDFEAWNGKLGATFDYFYRKRTGLFAQNESKMPTIVGAKAPLENLNSDCHFGLELELSHRNRIGDFSYGIKGMATITRQKFLTFVGNGNYGSSFDRWRSDDMNNRNQGFCFGYEGAGRFESWEDIWNYEGHVSRETLPGDYKYLDWNGDGQINGQDEHPYAFDQTPWMNYSLSFDMSWRGLDFSMLFQGSALGSMQYKEPLYAIWGKNGGGVLEQYTDRWHPAGEWTDPYDQSLQWIEGYYGLTNHYPDENSSFNRVSTDYLRLKSVEVGYTFANKRKHNNTSLRIFANAYNCLTFTNVNFVDPEHPDSELGRMYPLNKTMTVGLNLTF